MDKLGPIGRGVDDLGIVLAAIHGSDGRDQTVVNRPFQWPPRTPLDVSNLRVGIVPRGDKAPADESLEILRSLGCQIKEVKLPSDFPLLPMTNIIDVEGAAVFDDLLRAGQTEGWNTWTNTFRSAQFITAIDYLRMQRVRRRLMIAFEEAIRDVDVLWNANDLMHTNFTGHPSVILPYKIKKVRDIDLPQSVVITGHLFGEEKILALAQAFEKKLAPRPAPPPLDDFFAKFQSGELEKQPDDNGQKKSESPPKD